MFLELGRAISFFLSIASLYEVAVDAFFGVSTHWPDRLAVGLLRLVIAAFVCFGSGLLFAHPGDKRVTQTRRFDSSSGSCSAAAAVFRGMVCDVRQSAARRIQQHLRMMPARWRE